MGEEEPSTARISGRDGSGFSRAASADPSLKTRTWGDGACYNAAKMGPAKKNWIETQGGTWGSGSRLYKNSRGTSNLASSGVSWIFPIALYRPTKPGIGVAPHIAPIES